MKRENIRTMVLYALFIAMIFVLGLTPVGYINAGAIEITIIHIPVIIGAIVFGVRGGALLGFFFGLTSLIRALTVPTPLAMLLLGADTGFGWYNLLMIVMIIFIPRILVGIFSALIYSAMSRRSGKETLAMGVASVAGSLTNTVFFLGFTYILARTLIAQAFGMSVAAVAGLLFATTGLINGGIEAAAAAILCTAVGRALTVFLKRTGSKQTND